MKLRFERRNPAWLEAELRAALAARRPTPDFAWRTAVRAMHQPESEPAAGRHFWPAARPIRRGWRAAYSLAIGLLLALGLGIGLRRTPAPQPRQVQAQLQFAIRFTRMRVRRIVLRTLAGLKSHSSRGESL